MTAAGRPPRPPRGRCGRQAPAAARCRRGEAERVVLPQPGPGGAVELDVGRRQRGVAAGPGAGGSPSPSGTRVLPGSGRVRHPDAVPVGAVVRLPGMCGIVGYVGPSVDGTALDVVMEGLARLEYRGYDSAGVALVHDGQVVTRKKAGKLANLRAVAADDRCPATTTAIGHTRWATHGGPTDHNAHPHRGGARWQAGADPQRDHRELPRPQEAACSTTGVQFSCETDTEVAAHLVARAFERDRRPHRGDAGRRGATSRGRSPCSRCTPTRRASSSAHAATARWSSGSATGENFLGSGRRRLHRTHPPRARARPGPDRHDHPGLASRSSDFDGTPAEGKSYEVDLGRCRRREGRLRDVHGEGDPRAAARRRRHPAGPHRRRPAGWSSTRCRISEDALRSITRSSSSPAAPPPTPAWWPSTPSSTGPGSRAR